jgi:hypothetical protein
VIQACDGKARISGKGPRLHYTAIPAKQPAEIDLAIVMLDNRHIAPGGKGFLFFFNHYLSFSYFTVLLQQTEEFYIKINAWSHASKASQTVV